MSSEQMLIQIQSEGFFTATLPFDKFLSDLCKRFTRMYGEILPVNDYDYIIQRLQEKDII